MAIALSGTQEINISLCMRDAVKDMSKIKVRYREITRHRTKIGW